jgi:hypothetical protein
MSKKKQKLDLKQYHAERLAKLNAKAPFVLRITEWKDKPIPVLVIKERQFRDDEGDVRDAEGQRRKARPVQIERGSLYGEPQHRCLPVLRRILEPVTDAAGIPLELDRYMTAEGLRLRANLPLNEEAGAKLGLIFRLQDRLKDLERVELIAYRVAQFTREEAAYWLSRTTSFGPSANRWALSGLRIMLGGHPKDPDIVDMLERFRAA